MEFGLEHFHAAAVRGPRRGRDTNVCPGSAEDSDSPATYRVRQ